MVVLGFDPGGIGQFGWCVAEAARERRIKIRKSGTANSAAEAYSRSLEWVGDKTEIAAARSFGWQAVIARLIRPFARRCLILAP
jgi:hypothetical protein